MNTNDPAAEYTEATGPSGFTAASLNSLIMGTGLCDKPLFTTREIVRRCINTLIHEGRLRVVDECRIKIDNSSGEWNGMHLFGCNGRGPVTDEVFCPYCGNKVIKPTNP